MPTTIANNDAVPVYSPAPCTDSIHFFSLFSFFFFFLYSSALLIAAAFIRSVLGATQKHVDSHSKHVS